MLPPLDLHIENNLFWYSITFAQNYRSPRRCSLTHILWERHTHMHSYTERHSFSQGIENRQLHAFAKYSSSRNECIELYVKRNTNKSDTFSSPFFRTPPALSFSLFLPSSQSPSFHIQYHRMNQLLCSFKWSVIPLLASKSLSPSWHRPGVKETNNNDDSLAKHYAWHVCSLRCKQREEMQLFIFFSLLWSTCIVDSLFSDCCVQWIEFFRCYEWRPDIVGWIISVCYMSHCLTDCLPPVCLSRHPSFSPPSFSLPSFSLWEGETRHSL